MRDAPGDRLPAFPWDALRPHRERAAQHPDGLVDLSVGSPVDPVPASVQEALAEASGRPGYPTTHGTDRVREAAASWLARRHQVSVDPATQVLPVIGLKETVALLPWLCGAGPGTRVLHPALAYPTYDVGARLAGATPVPADDVPAALADADAARADGPVALVWLNSPSNPTGAVAGVEELRAAVDAARTAGVLLISDECYLPLGFDAEPVSVLHPEVCGGDPTGLLAAHSLSKRSNLAGYRAGCVVGDPAVVARLLEVRRHAGLMVPGPVQAAAAAAWDDDVAADAQKERYAARRQVLLDALRHGGYVVEHSQAGLYLWVRRDGSDAWALVERLAGLGVLVAPGTFYGEAGRDHVRVSLTATDERVAAAADRLRTG